jgi:hypothetical protein
MNEAVSGIFDLQGLVEYTKSRSCDFKCIIYLEYPLCGKELSLVVTSLVA